MLRILAALFSLAIIFGSTLAHAKVKSVGSGDRMTFDAAQIPTEFKGAFEIMKVKCIQCHTMERIVMAVQTGVAPVTGQPFDKQQTKAYGIKMLRKPKANMNKTEVKQVVELMNYLLDLSAKP